MAARRWKLSSVSSDLHLGPAASSYICVICAQPQLLLPEYAGIDVLRRAGAAVTVASVESDLTVTCRYRSWGRGHHAR